MLKVAKCAAIIFFSPRNNPRTVKNHNIANVSSIITLTNGFNICRFNTNSLRRRIENLRLFISTKYLFHVIVVIEAKLEEHIPSESSAQ